MKSEQLKLLGNVIEFPNSKAFKNKEMLDKFYAATELLKIMVEQGHEFSITVNRNAALEVFEEKNGNTIDLLVISTSKEFEEGCRNKNKCYFFVEGDEF